MTTGLLRAAALLPCLLMTPALAAEPSPWLLRLGIHEISPNSDAGTVAGARLDVDSRLGPTFNIGYFLTPNWAIDVLAALPFKHDLSLNGAKVGSTRQLPPTVSLQYHFLPDAAFSPYVAAGINYTTFWEDKLDNSPAGLDIEDSWGLAAQLGLDIRLDLQGQWRLGMDLRYIDIDADVKVAGVKAGTAKIDPLAYGMTLGYRF
jgi:outer membrane protein